MNGADDEDRRIAREYLQLYVAMPTDGEVDIVAVIVHKARKLEPRINSGLDLMGWADDDAD